MNRQRREYGGRVMEGHHLVFVWLDPGNALADRSHTHDMPEKYRRNVQRWRVAYGDAAVVVLDGQQCVDSVARVDRLGYVNGLEAQYRSFAGRWDPLLLTCVHCNV